MIHVQLTAVDEWWSWALQRITNCRYSHSRLVRTRGPWKRWVIDAHIVPGFSADGAAIDKGVAYRDPESIPTTRVLDIIFADAPDSIEEKAESLIGRPYGMRSLFAFAFPWMLRKDWTEREGFTCAELIAYCTMMDRYPLWHPNASFHVVTPRDLMLSSFGKWEEATV